MGDIVISGQLLLAVPIALLAGLVSFASPCVLPLVPGYLAYVGGFTDADERAARGRRRVVLGVLLFILGFSLVFVLYGTAAGSIGFWMQRYSDVITRVLGVVVIAMGLVFIGQFSFLQRTLRPSIRPRPASSALRCSASSSASAGRPASARRSARSSPWGSGRARRGGARSSR